MDNNNLKQLPKSCPHNECFNSSPSKIEGVGGSMISKSLIPNRFVIPLSHFVTAPLLGEQLKVHYFC